MGMTLSIECDVCGADEDFDSIEDLEANLHYYGAWTICIVCGDATCDACIEAGDLACTCKDERQERRSEYQPHPDRSRALPAHIEDKWTTKRAPNTEPCPACGVVHSAR
jgi:hypothetical protein